MTEPENKKIYTAITFSPVQGFIEKSRKLRDLYGSSFLLSYLSEAICKAARRQLNPPEVDSPLNRDPVVSPALINVTQGMPNQIIIEGYFPKQDAQEAFYKVWKDITKTCRQWIEKHIEYKFENSGENYIQTNQRWQYCWSREWQLWATHAWEFFWATGKTINIARENLNEIKRSRNWVGINWLGESSTLSGADAIAYPAMGLIQPKQWNYSQEKTIVEAFYKQLSWKVGEAYITTDEKRRLPSGQYLERCQELGAAIIDPNEELSIPELVKRLITLEEIAQEAGIPKKELPKTFQKLNRFESEHPTGWFMGDGDRAGDFLLRQGNSAAVLHNFSRKMREWGKQFKDFLPNDRVVYAGGDDFMGVFYSDSPDRPLAPQHCLNWFYSFPHIWQTHQQPITASIGFVWAASGIPQRDVLQHCRQAEKSAKNSGRDRLCIRVLFNSGNSLEWTCPWWFLNILQNYRDREGGKNWGHLFEDIAILESRHALTSSSSVSTTQPWRAWIQQQCGVALALFAIYFGQEQRQALEEHLWDSCDCRSRTCITGILGNSAVDWESVPEALNNWIINLAKVGYHLHRTPEPKYSTL